MYRVITCLTIVLNFALVTSSHAAFVAAADLDPGNAQSFHPNFSFGGDTTSASSSIPSAAVGLPSHDSIFGGNGANFGDTYIMSYTPGVDADNFSPASGSLLGSTTGFGTELASGLLGGVTGLYNVYVTVPETTGISASSDFTITGDGTPVQVLGITMNSGNTGADQDPGPAFVGGANNAWYKLGTVHLTAGNTYTMTQVATNNTFVSQRLSGVMWERTIPEPSSLLLLALAATVGKHVYFPRNCR